MRRATFLFLISMALATYSGAQTCDGMSAGPGSRFQGRVEDSAGNPVNGAQVELYAPSGAMLDSASTVGGGLFSFNRDFADGSYQLKVSIQGQVFAVQAYKQGSQSVIRIPLASRTQLRPISATTVSVNDLRVSSRARKSYEKARRQMERGQIGAATSYINAAITEEPHWSQALYLQGVLLLQQNRAAEATHSFEAALQSNPNDGLVLAALGSAYETLNDFKQAEFYLNRAANRPQAPWQAWLELANLHLREQRYIESENDAAMALKADSAASPLCHYVLGQAAIAAADYSRAQAELDTFVRIAPQSQHATHARQQLAELNQMLPAR